MITLTEDLETELRNEIKMLKQEIELLKEENAYLKRKLYGKSSEKAAPDEQTSLFDDDQAEDTFTQPETTGQQTEAITVQIHKKKRTNRQKEKVNQNLPVRKVVIPLGSPFCDECGHKLAVIGEKFVNRKVVFVPAKLYFQETYKQVGKCDHCSNDESHFGDKLITPASPVSLIVHSLLSPSLLTKLAYDKFVMAQPLDRQRRDLGTFGFQVSEPTLSNWIIKGADWLNPLTDILHDTLMNQAYIHGDETPIQVLRELNKPATSKSYLWVIRSAIQYHQAVAYYHYAPTRSGTVVNDLYGNYHGNLLCDGYAGYNQLPETVQRSGCWAHARRKFFEAANGSNSSQSHAREAFILIDQLFADDRKSRNFSPEAKLDFRQKIMKPKMDHFWELITSYHALPETKLGRAVAYALKERPYLEAYLSDPNIALSNNIAERIVKPSVIGRKNWLFSTSQAGAKANTIFLTVVETAKANHLNVRKYLTFLFKQLPLLGPFPKKEKLQAYLPWATQIQEQCHK